MNLVDSVRTGNKCEVPRCLDAKISQIRLLRSAADRKASGFNRKLSAFYVAIDTPFDQTDDAL
jgi:hypothetical protein